MAYLLEELKRQREQIQKHLDWLDAKITELSKDGAIEKSDAAAASSDKQSAAPKKELPEGAQLCSLSEAEIKEATADTESPTRLIEPDPDAPVYKEQTQGELRRAQIGCLVLFVLSTVLFLFLLFGLPYLL